MSETISQPLEYRRPERAPGKPLVVALAGNPNCGKTTLFNALTGLRQKVANYPGVTVEKKTGRCKLPGGQWLDVIDLPGTYSLISRSPDEQVAMEVLRGLRPETPPPDVVIVVVDASNLQRNLYLVSQLIELGRPMVLALNMTDIAERRGIRIDVEALSREIGVEVVPVVGHKRRGIDVLKSAVGRAAVAPLPAWPLLEPMREELLALAAGLAQAELELVEQPSDNLPLPVPRERAGVRARRCLDTEEPKPVIRDVEGESTPPLPDGRGSFETVSSAESFEIRTATAGDETSASGPGPLPSHREGEAEPARARHDRYEAIAERLLIGDHAPDVLSLVHHPSVDALLKHSLGRLRERGIDPMQADIESHYAWIEGVTGRVVHLPAVNPVNAETGTTLQYATPPTTTSEKVDAVLIHKVWGLLIFVSVMAGLFVSIFWLADPIMGATENAVTATGNWLTASMGEGALKSLINDGIFHGVGAVVVFVPQIAILFFCLAILEDSGYLARAAFLMDRLLGKVGLSGKAFIPLLSSFACAIPGIMATRTIENRRDRLATIFVAPFMSCSARLPVYALLIGAFFAGYGAIAKGGVMLGCYALGVLAAVVTAWVFKRTFLKGPPQAFILELPSYKVPQVSQVARVVWTNTAKFLTKAGTIIFCLTVILWAMSYYPRLPGVDDGTLAKQLEADAIKGMLHQSAATSAQVEKQNPNGPTSNINAVNTRRLAAESSVIASDQSVAPEKKVERLYELIGNTWRPRFEPQGELAAGSAQSEYSLSGRLGHFIEPAIRPLGYDWKMGVGLVAAFAAREVFVSSLGVVYSVGDVEDDDSALQQQILADTYPDGKKVWTPLVAVSLLIWFVLAMQCMSTLAIVRRETGGWRWPLGMLVYMNALAYVVCLIVYQVGSRLG